jgi:hypothetical protein
VIKKILEDKSLAAPRLAERSRRHKLKETPSLTKELLNQKMF